jgi:hypothetical protein
VSASSILGVVERDQVLELPGRHPGVQGLVLLEVAGVEVALVVRVEQAHVLLGGGVVVVHVPQVHEEEERPFVGRGQPARHLL